MADQVALQRQSPGAYDVWWGTDTIRIAVLREMPEADQNLVWNLFSGDPERIAGAFQRLKPRLPSWSSLLNDLLTFYGLEGMAMPYTVEDFERDTAELVLSRLTPEQRLAGLTPEQRLEGLSSEQRLEGLSPEQVLAHLSPEQVLAHLSLAEIEKYVKKQKAASERSTPQRPDTPS